MIKKLYYPSFADVTPCKIELAGELNEDGELEPAGVWEGRVNYSQTSKRVQNSDGLWVPLSGVIHVCGDIFPNLPNLAGYAYIEGNKMEIIKLDKVRNPDGTINHTRIELK